MIEYAVFHYRFHDEPHRGPYTLEEAQEFITETEDDGFPKGVFVIRERLVGEWQSLDTRLFGNSLRVVVEGTDWLLTPNGRYNVDAPENAELMEKYRRWENDKRTDRS